MAVTLLAYALTTLENVKESLSITASDDDDLLKRLINAATELIESETGRRFKKTDHEGELHDGEGQDLALTNYPILDSDDSETDPVISHVYDSRGNSDVIDEDTYRYNKKIGNVFRSSGWPEGSDNISVDYTAGYETIPSDLEQACIELVSLTYNRRKSLGIKDESDGAYSISYADAQKSPQTQTVIELYKNIGLL